MKAPIGKSLFVDSKNRLWIVSRERDHDGTTVYGLARVHHEFVDGFKHKYEAVQAAETQP